MQALQGVISVQSKVDEGTTVSVTIPLEKSNVTDQSYTDPTHAPSLLQEQLARKTVFIYGSALDTGTLLGESLRLYIAEWFHLEVVERVSRADFVIVDESELDELTARSKAVFVRSRVAVLRSTFLTQQPSPMETDDILKPFGPGRLAKGLLDSWAHKPTRTTVLSRSLSLQTLTRSQEFDSALIHSADSPTSTDAPSRNGTGPLELAHPEKSLQQPPGSKHHALKQKSVLPEPTEDATNTVESSHYNNRHTSPLARQVQPHILIVDDNHINLKLLKAYLEKLNYANIKSARDGLEALNIVESSDDGFDLIFMGN